MWINRCSVNMVYADVQTLKHHGINSKDADQQIIMS